jgi:hypothetical protein
MLILGKSSWGLLHKRKNLLVSKKGWLLFDPFSDIESLRQLPRARPPCAHPPQFLRPAPSLCLLIKRSNALTIIDLKDKDCVVSGHLVKRRKCGAGLGILGAGGRRAGEAEKRFALRLGFV